MGHLLVRGDARSLPVRSGSVHCVVTSPPYFNLRDYGTGQWDGGDPDCDHRSPTMRVGRNEDRPKLAGSPATNSYQLQLAHRTGCGKCGAVKVDRQIGLEQTPDGFVAAMVEVAREIRRVLTDDGVFWLNLGDSYFGGGYSNHRINGEDWQERMNGDKRQSRQSDLKRSNPTLKPKDLIGVPWRVAFALQEDGWYLRSGVPWVKRSAMPESTEDRPASALEYVFLLTKNVRYHYDAEAVRKASAGSTLDRDRYSRITRGKDGPYAVQHDHETPSDPGGRHRRNADWWFESVGMLMNAVGDPLGFDVNTQSFRGAHFATFPERLVEPCVLSGTSEAGCCPNCQRQWRRVVDRYRTKDGVRRDDIGAWRSTDIANPGSAQGSGHWRFATVMETTGWEPSCRCPAHEPESCVVLDPFAGSGTVGVVARRLGRRFLGLDLNPTYLAMASDRIRKSLRPESRLDRVTRVKPFPGQPTLFDLEA